ncbi:MAG TPA: hypothetical protein VMB26_08230 [Candidatus Binataceae bacterium]|nr:hypothetical protein [Candidatus Binataceae bacterium]
MGRRNFDGLLRRGFVGVKTHRPISRTREDYRWTGWRQGRDLGGNAEARLTLAAMRLVELLQNDFVREQESRRSVRELYQVHQPVEVIQFAQNDRLLVEMRTSCTVAHRLQELAEPSAY